MPPNYLWSTQDYPCCRPTTSGRPQAILTAIQLPLIEPRLSLLSSKYLQYTPDNPHCHLNNSGRPQTILNTIQLPGKPQTTVTAIQLHLVYPRLPSLPSICLWSTSDHPYCHPVTSVVPDYPHCDPANSGRP